jgi:hypothetical protein
VFLSLCYVVLRRVLQLAALRFRSNDHKLEIVVLRHELAILRRRTRRPVMTWTDRLFLAAASRLEPRRGDCPDSGRDACESFGVVLSEPYSDGVYPPVTSNRDGLSHLLVEGLRSVKGTPIDAVAWSRSPISRPRRLSRPLGHSIHATQSRTAHATTRVRAICGSRHNGSTS